MKLIYRMFTSFLESLLVQTIIFKTWLFEWISIIRKSYLYKHVHWSDEQHKTFNDFWIRFYGTEISGRWHRLYQSINDTFDPQYFPDIIFSTKLEPKLNPIIYSKFISDKSLTELIYSNVPGIKFPQTIVLNCSGTFYDGERNLIDYERALQLLNNSGDIVIKPIIGGSSGKGVQIISFNDSGLLAGNKSVNSILEEYKQNYIVQARLKANTQYSTLYQHSINTIRLITYIVKDEIHHAPLCLRMGNNMKQVDNIHAGGLVIGVSDNGILNQYAYKLGYANKKERYKAHPDTGIVFKEYQLPGTLEMISVAKELHKKTPHLGIISWDFTFDENNKVVLVEGNYFGQSIWFPQIVHAKAFFGRHTQNMLNLLK